jgi:hypothetical protein
MHAFGKDHTRGVFWSSRPMELCKFRLCREILLREAGEGDRAKRGGGGMHGSVNNINAAKIAGRRSQTQFSTRVPAPSTILRMVPLPRFAEEEMTPR